MQRWEYVQISITRREQGKDELYSALNGWTRFPLENWGNAGYELVSVFPVSSEYGIPTAGLTTEIVYVFKKPIEEDK
jgi:hypothetical protein